MATKFDTAAVSPIYSVSVFDLPCFTDRKWAPVRTGDYGADCEHGRRLGSEMLHLIQASQNHQVLTGVTRAIVEAGQWDGVEIGFFHAIGLSVLR